MVYCAINHHHAARGRLWARWGLDPALGLLNGVYAEWAGGDFVRLEPAAHPPRECAPSECFGSHLLTPGLLNAHAHLDYSFLRGMLPRGVGFTPWLQAMIHTRRGLRPEDEPARRRACHEAIGRMTRGGVTEVWDISSFGWARQGLLGTTLRGFSFEEWLAPRRAAWDPAWRAWLARFARDCATLGPATRDRLLGGISAHSVYSVCPDALHAAAEYARRGHYALALHLAESPEEIAMTMQGQGALAELLANVSGTDMVAELGGAGLSPVRRAASAGALGPHTVAIHGNLPQEGDVQALAESGAVVVFCPRSHAFFGYPPYPLKAYRQWRARLALGTDSLASNDSLDMREEIRAFAALAAGWRPLEILGLATGAALGAQPPLGGRGRLEQWKNAQWALWRLEQAPGVGSIEGLFERLLAPETELEASSAMMLTAGGMPGHS